MDQPEPALIKTILAFSAETALTHAQKKPANATSDPHGHPALAPRRC